MVALLLDSMLQSVLLLHKHVILGLTLLQLSTRYLHISVDSGNLTLFLVKDSLELLF